MGLIRKASEIEAKGTIAMLIYGQPGVGKSTLAMSAPDAVLFDYDGGVNRVNGAHRGLTVQIRSWEDTNAALDEIEGEHPEIRTIVIDTAGKMLDYMSEFIMRTEPRMRKGDGSLSLQGYGARKGMFISFLGRVATCGRNVVFIAHEREEKRGEEIVKRPEIGGSSGNDLIKELDLVGYMEMRGTNRTLHFNPTEWFYAKNSCGLAPSVTVRGLFDKEGRPSVKNDFLAEVIKSFTDSQNEQRELRLAYDTLMEDIDAALVYATDGKGLNDILDAIDRREEVFNSRMAGTARVAKRARELGLKADPVTRRFPVEAKREAAKAAPEPQVAVPQEEGLL